MAVALTTAVTAEFSVRRSSSHAGRVINALSKKPQSTVTRTTPASAYMAATRPGNWFRALTSPRGEVSRVTSSARMHAKTDRPTKGGCATRIRDAPTRTVTRLWPLSKISPGGDCLDADGRCDGKIGWPTEHVMHPAHLADVAAR